MRSGNVSVQEWSRVNWSSKLTPLCSLIELSFPQSLNKSLVKYSVLSSLNFPSLNPFSKCILLLVAMSSICFGVMLKKLEISELGSIFLISVSSTSTGALNNLICLSFFILLRAIVNNCTGRPISDTFYVNIQEYFIFLDWKSTFMPCNVFKSWQAGVFWSKVQLF